MAYSYFLALSHVFVKMILTGLTEVSLFAINGRAVSPSTLPAEGCCGRVLTKMRM
jgi:hypothetical protein